MVDHERNECAKRSEAVKAALAMTVRVMYALARVMSRHNMPTSELLSAIQEAERAL